MKQKKEVLIMSQNHTDEFEEKKFAFITYKSITDEYGVSKASQSK